MTTHMIMSSSISSHSFLCSTISKPCIYSLSSLVSCPKTTKFHRTTWVSQMGFSPFSLWSGLKHLGISVSPRSITLEKKRRCKGRVVHASLFGVGAPEALVIGVVALLVFGPKGLAEVARNLGKTLRAFQPTIRELQDVSREFKSTLEREIGLDEVSNSTQSTYSSSRTNTVSPPPSVASTDNSQTLVDPNGSPSQKTAYTSEEYLKITEEQLKASAAQQQMQSPPLGESPSGPQNQPQATVKETAGTTPPPQKPEI